MALVLCCRACSEEHFHEDGEIPSICPACGSHPAPWKSASVVEDPSVPYELSDRDWRTLKALWIDPKS